ncbi:MAG: peptidylprolyl isomerase [Deltaproteobacteria bacterium]
MKAKAPFVLLSFSLLVFLAGTLHAQKAEQQTSTGGKAAIVNGVVIQEEEVNQFLLYQQQRLLATTGQAIRPDMMMEVRKQVLEQLIDRELLYQQSRKKGISIKDAEVNAQLDQLKKQYPNEQAFKDSMAEEHLTEDTLKSRIRMNMAVQQFVEKEFAGKTAVTEAEAKTFYDGNPQYFKEPETIRVSEIMIKADPAAEAAKKQEARKKLEDIRNRLQKGEDFGILAKDFSQSPSANQGGDLGVLPKGTMPKAFDDAAFSLKPGEVSGVVETELGFHLIKVHEKKPEKVVPFKETEERVRQHLEGQKLQQKVGEYLTEAKKTAKIERISTKGAN